MEGKEGVKLARNRKARDRAVSLQESEVSLGDEIKKQPQHCLVDHPGIRSFRGPRPGVTSGQQSWAGGWNQGQADLLHAKHGTDS